MNPEEKELLERTYRLAEENNQILKGMRRSQRIGSAIRFLYWLLIIGLTIAGFYFAQTYVQNLTSTLFGDEKSGTNLIEQYRDLLEE